MLFNRFVIFASIFFGFSFVVRAQEMSRTAEPPPKSRALTETPNLLAPTIYVVPLPALPADIPQIGEGFDLLKGERRSSNCVAHGGATKNTVENIQSTLSEVTDDEMLWRKLSTSIEAKASYAGYSGGGSYAETNESRTSTSKVSVVAKSTHITTATNLLPSTNSIQIGFLPATRIDLTTAAYNMLANGKFADFRQTCGDGYVAQISIGGQFFSTFDFSSLDFESKRSIVASVTASGPGDAFSATGKSNFQEEMTKRSKTLKIDYSQQGGAFKLNPTTKEELIQAFKVFPEDVRKAPRVVFISIIRYDSLGSMSALPTKIKAYWIYADQAIRQLLRLQSVRNDFASALASMNSESGLPPPQVADYIYIKEIEDKGYFGKGSRSLVHFKSHLQQLQVLTRALGSWLATCLSTATSAACTPPDASFSEYDDLMWRARAPIARADIQISDEQELRALAGGGPTPTVEAACYFAQILRSNVIRRIAAVRQKYDNSGDEEKTQAAEDEVLRTLGLTTSDCLNFATSPALQTSKLKLGASFLPKP